MQAPFKAPLQSINNQTFLYTCAFWGVATYRDDGRCIARACSDQTVQIVPLPSSPDGGLA